MVSLLTRRCKQRRPETFWRMCIGLARALFMNPTILLLDEEWELIAAAAERRMMRHKPVEALEMAIEGSPHELETKDASFIFAAMCCVPTDALGMLGTIGTGVAIYVTLLDS
ncbi:hypothetical protein Tco_1003793 [Tanacetum coccineum]|uniref:Uncharacterized protein n=1 Tax=Tanacetum coccineum TaxID=301880 RepID=A0ABQ5FAE4_9ASTR